MSSAFIRRPFVLAVLLATIACGSSPTAPDQTGPVRLTAQIDRSEIASGGTAVVSFRLENVTSSAITLSFPSSCQVQRFIARRPSNEIVYPSGGSWVCLTVVTSLTLAPNSVTVSELALVAGDSTSSRVGLAPGEYTAFARVQSMEHTLESARVSLTVR